MLRTTRCRAAVLSLAFSFAAAGCGSGKRTDTFFQEPTDAAARDAPTSVDSPPIDMGMAGECMTQAQCDDGQACTDDACVVGGRCEHMPVASRCAAGERCIVGVGCSTGIACMTTAQCDDGVACTHDLCNSTHTCQHDNNDAMCTGGQVCISTGCAAAGSCAIDSDCNDRVFCNGVERCMGGRCAAGTRMDCADTDPCTGDICNEMTQRCDHPAVTPCGGSVTGGNYTLAPPVAYSCGAGSIGPVVNIALGVTATGVTVVGFPNATTTLTGAVPMDGMFSASGQESRGSCTWRYTLSGSFTMPNRFSGSWNITFDNCLSIYSCFSQSGIVDGTRR